MGKQVEVRAECPWCGPLVVAVELFRCEIEPDRPSRGMCELSCPGCSRTVFLAAAAPAIQALFAAGGRRLPGPVPFELLERRSGDAISWDDLLDFKMALDQTPWPQVELDG